jgi:hypothetical protein
MIKKSVQSVRFASGIGRIAKNVKGKKNHVVILEKEGEWMQNDLISRSALIEKFKDKISRTTNNTILRIFLLEAIKIVENEPTAYDVEKVVAELETSSGKGYRDIDGDYVPPMIETTKAISIVRNGGKE